MSNKRRLWDVWNVSERYVEIDFIGCHLDIYVIEAIEDDHRGEYSESIEFLCISREEETSTRLIFKRC